jgi:hypothetical protein
MGKADKSMRGMGIGKWEMNWKWDGIGRKRDGIMEDCCADIVGLRK